MGRIMKVSFVLGKFYPLHQGHISLIDFALSVSEKLIILVDNHESYLMSLEERVKRIKETYPNVEVRGIQESTFQNPEESSEFWEYWKNICEKYVPEEKEAIIGSMEYVFDLAKVLNIKPIVIDIEREGINFSATRFRNDPKKEWKFLAPESKKFLCKKIAIMGAESSGKSTLVKKLANNFDTNFVPEYGRTFAENLERPFQTEDFVEIAKFHDKHASVLAKHSNYYFFYDTEAITTLCWQDFLVQQKSEEIENIIRNQKIDLYILVPVQDQWVNDGVRYQKEKEERIIFYNKIKENLIRYNKNFIEIKNGSYTQVYEDVCEKIEELYE